MRYIINSNRTRCLLVLRRLINNFERLLPPPIPSPPSLHTPLPLIARLLLPHLCLLFLILHLFRFPPPFLFFSYLILHLTLHGYPHHKIWHLHHIQLQNNVEQQRKRVCCVRFCIATLRRRNMNVEQGGEEEEDEERKSRR